MIIKKAETEELNSIYFLVKDTILKEYYKYYTQEIVHFFLSLHSRNEISKDIKLGQVYIITDNNLNIVATGSISKNHIKRIFVRYDLFGLGYGKMIMNYLENIIMKDYDTITLDSTLGATSFYKRLNYEVEEHNKYIIKNKEVLFYDSFIKKLSR